MLSLAEGKILVKLARETVERKFRLGKFYVKRVDEKFEEKRGVFVTIETFPEKELRGCIGFISPIYPLYEAVQRASYASAFEDFRFLPLKEEELKRVTFKVSILTKPELVKVKNAEEYKKKIELGKDGLILVYGNNQGVFLPEVPIEAGWNIEEYLENLCFKAGLTPDVIYEKDAKIFKFQTQVFGEKEPEGEVVELYANNTSKYSKA
jgi:uncharacterized protein (TIGR00296 family)